MTLLEKLQQLLEENATAEEIQSSLGEFMIPIGTFNKVNDELKELKGANIENQNLKEQLANAKSELEELKTSNMNEKELLQHQLEKAQEQLRINALETNKANAINKFVSAGFEEEEYQPLLETVISEDPNMTNKLVDSIIGLADTKAEKKVQEKVNSMLEGNLDLPKGGEAEGHGEITLEEFESMSVLEKNKLFTEQRDVYDKLIAQKIE